MIREGDLVRVTIDAMDDEGRGRASGHAVDLCVRGAFLGDDVTARVERVFAVAGVAQAVALTLHGDHPDGNYAHGGPCHTARTCPHSAPCAACPLHGLAPDVAVDLKRARITDAFADVGLHVEVGDVVPAAAPRQKIKLVHAHGRLGLYTPHSHELVAADQCPHHDALLNSALARLRPLLSDDVKAVVARRFAQGVGVVLVCQRAVVLTAAHIAVVDGAPIVSLAVRVDASGGNSIVSGAVSSAYGPTLLTPLDGGPAQDVDAFCQTDPVLAQALYRRAAAFVVGGNDKAGRYADLYAGTGGFSRALLAHGAARVVAVERTRENCSALTTLHVDAIDSSVEAALPRLAALAPFAGLIADPPKKGLGGAARDIAALGAARVALVACDADAGAKDAKVFVAAGYQIDVVEPYDLFVATPEVETLILLSRPHHA